MNNNNTEVVALPPVVSVYVLLYDAAGPRAMYGGVCPILAQALARASQVEASGVTRRVDMFEPLGQDIFDASYTAVMRLRGLFDFMTFAEIDQLHQRWPEGFRYAFVVSR